VNCHSLRVLVANIRGEYSPSHQCEIGLKDNSVGNVAMNGDETMEI